jgi:hypothetical protein
MVSGYFGLEASLRHGNLGSAPNWRDPPITASERFWMNFPSEYFFIAGLLLLVIAFVRVIVWAVRPSDETRHIIGVIGLFLLALGLSLGFAAIGLRLFQATL